MVKTTQTKKFISSLFLLALAACAKPNDWPAIDETGNETASVVPSNPSDGSATPEDQTPNTEMTQKMILNQAMTIRYEKSGILEAKVELPVGTQIEIPVDYEVKNLDYRNSGGGVERSSTGFIFPVKVISVTPQFASQFSSSKLAEINNTSGGLYIFASIVGNLQGLEGNFAAISSSIASPGFLKYYDPSGKPLFKYTNAITKRFGASVNKGVDATKLSTSVRDKWQKIFAELVKAVDRTKETPKYYLMMDVAKAKQASIDFENSGVISPVGAWTVATQGTAVRHGFANVPCAETQSEILRQAYQRAGYRVTDDFSSAKGNPLIYSNTAAVVNFSMALFKAGWVPWDATVYRPITGAFLMNGSGLTPGHTYIAAGENGMIIVDNGAPQGRDLRKTTEKTISIMYETGVFFLPPGINPPKW